MSEIECCHGSGDKPSTNETTSATKTTTTTTTTTTKAAVYDDDCYNYQLKLLPSSLSSFDNAPHSNRNCFSFLNLILCVVVIFDRLTVIALAAPQSCALCRQNDLKADTKDPNASYEEFLFEHQVTRQDAIRALRILNESFFEETSASAACKAVSCTKNVMKYCLGPQFINDHCWCELGHTQEGLPFIPHICYVGEKEYSASVGSCFFYEEVKDCCCAAALAKQWRHISAAGPQTSAFSTIFVVILLNMFVARLLFES